MKQQFNSAWAKLTFFVMALLLAGGDCGKARAQGTSDNSSGPKPDATVPVVRGWRIDSVSAIKKAAVAELYPQYKGRKLVGTSQSNRRPAKGEFMIVLVESSWASLDAPDEPLWVGKPDVSIVDSKGVEYPAKDMLARRSGEYVQLGMLAAPVRRGRGVSTPRISRLLAYFDVPANPGQVSLRFPNGGPLIEVNQVKDFPDATRDLP